MWSRALIDKQLMRDHQAFLRNPIFILLRTFGVEGRSRFSTILTDGIATTTDPTYLPGSCPVQRSPQDVEVMFSQEGEGTQSGGTEGLSSRARTSFNLGYLCLSDE